ncbi:hypothetical protein HPP92_027115 [Vanilla planifolia]|uniref:Uncharacterized protein n=1 Tax=Vanilla planifolia TaxID=51239 RepID=A0A835PBY3_VANPL|nr:hypothetical protein HPP92_027115 [Vanilla planifolia]
MVVLTPKSIGHHQPVMPRMHVLVQNSVDVHVSVPHVLPRVNHHHRHREPPPGHGPIQKNCGVTRYPWFGFGFGAELEGEAGDHKLEKLLKKNPLDNIEL